MKKEKITIYCDGACSGNQNERSPGGWGAVIKSQNKLQKIYGGEKNTTNNRMELTACIKALEQVKNINAEIEIFSDSAYLVNCINERWYERWRRNGWRTSKKQPVENKDLWEKLLMLINQTGARFHKVAGHSGDELNEMADQLANRGIVEPGGGSENSDVSNLNSNDALSADQLSYTVVEDGYLLRLQRGVRVRETLHDFIAAQKIASGTVSAIGALEDVELGYFQLSDKQYLRKKFPEIYELISFSGNISYVDGAPFVHAHAVLGGPEYRPIAGHFFDGTVAVTMEVHLRAFDRKITRQWDEETGLKLLDL